MHRDVARWIAQGTVRFALPIGILVTCAVLLGRQVSVDVLAALPQQLTSISAWQWALAALFTVGSFWAVAQYDVQAHRTLATGATERHARLTGAVGIAIGQTVGFGVLTGALARWRMLPELSVGQAVKLSAVVSLTFVVAWVCTTGLVVAVLPAPKWTVILTIVACLLLPSCLFILFRHPSLRLGKYSVPLPSLPVAGAILLWAMVDMVLAAAALWILLPAGTLPFVTLLPLFMVALGCGLISNTPGGLGPFELILVSALTTAVDAGILAGIMGFRLVYYAIPACLAAVVMMRPLPATPRTPTRSADWTLIPRSEVQALRQNGGWVEHRHGAALWPTSQTMTLFTDPAREPGPATLRWLRATARTAGRSAMIYKCSGRLARLARRAGWAVLHIADDAIIDTTGYTIDTPSRSRLRRKLRAADKAGVHVRATQSLDPKIADALDHEWQAHNGRARGGSMGRYSESYVQDQWVVAAYSANQVVAFATFQRGDTEWCLDLMRHAPTTPDGVMHALVNRGILDAQAAGVHRVSLASIVACPDPASAIWRWAAQHAVHSAGGTGLRQFKSAFAPRWVPRYAAAPSWPALALGLADLARTIRSPAPLYRADPKNVHQEDENYELASRRIA